MIHNYAIRVIVEVGTIGLALIGLFAWALCRQADHGDRLGHAAWNQHIDDVLMLSNGDIDAEYEQLCREGA